MAVAKETLNQPRTAQASACYCHCCQPARASGEEVKAMATTETMVESKTAWGATVKTYPDRKCQDCVHCESGNICAKGDKDATGPEAQTCYRYLTEATASRRYAAQDARDRKACPVCGGHDCYGDCEAAERN